MKEIEAEIAAIKNIVAELSKLDEGQVSRVMDYVAQHIGLSPRSSKTEGSPKEESTPIFDSRVHRDEETAE